MGYLVDILTIQRGKGSTERSEHRELKREDKAEAGWTGTHFQPLLGTRDSGITWICVHFYL